MATGTIKSDFARSVVSLSNSKNTTYVDTVHYAIAEKIGAVKRFSLNFNFKSVTVPNGTTLFTLPEEYRPILGSGIPLSAGGNYLCQLWIDNATGTIMTQKEITGANYATANATFL